MLGVWGYEASVGTAVQGRLTIRGEMGRWHGRIDGHETSVIARGNAFAIEFPDGAGQFRGTLRNDAGTIDGFWIRPAAADDPRYPGGVTQAFATPVTLRADGRHRWVGEVHALPDRFRLYLKVFRDEKGRLLGAFRDPDQNRTGGASRFLVAVDGPAIRFGQPGEAGGFETAFTGELLDEGARLKVSWPDLGRDIVLERRTPSQAYALLPRPPGAAPYAYRAPDALDDGWSVARGRDVGLDEAAMAAAVQGIIDGDPVARAPSLIHSILIARRGKLVLEEYFFGFGRDTPHDTRSAGKTFASVLLGAVRHQGVAIGPESKVVEVMADRGPFAHLDPRKASITLAQLMTHSAGLACNDNDDESPGNEGTMQAQGAQPDWWKYTLDLPMAHDPGTRYAYCSANMNLVGGALSTATHTWLPELFERRVARPLGFGEYHWNLMPNGEGYLGGGAFLRPRDLLKVGQAWLDGGIWRGQRIADTGWIAETVAPRIAVTPETTGYDEDEFGNYYGRGEDGYAWHLGELRAGGHAFHTYAATGNGGQMLVVVPELELVFVFTGGNYRQGGIWSQWPNRIIGAQILAASGTEL